MTARSKKASAKNTSAPAKATQEKKIKRKSSKAHAPITPLLLNQIQLIKEGKALTQGHIATKLGADSTGLNQMIKAKRGFSYSILKNFMIYSTSI